ncbi:MAG TPA: TetR/AcrR family transcriptional regulator [Stellaceae bacterium]|nr:TetR/AcrR family transcriptional regulator [Stellaceae bacterium]
MQKPRTREPAGPAQPVRARILGAAFAAFTEQGYAGTTTLDIATRAKVSKRDLYANFGNKEAMLLACIESRTERMRLPADRPAPHDREGLAASLTQFGATLLREGSHPFVVAMFRLAVAEATRAPEVAHTLEESGRGATRRALAELLAGAQAARLIGAGEPSDMAAQFLPLLWGDLLLNLLLGLAAAPGPADIAKRAENAAAAFLRLYPAPAGRK